ncbi:DUF1190 domain-containing protein [Microvirga sp. BT689]|nr:DUF1190 domain-containing protein [Microvirga arvi]
MQYRWTAVLHAALALSGFVLLALPLQAETRTALYVTSRTCQTEGLLSADQCRNAFANAEAEYYDNVPVFDGKEQCEKQFRHCAISFAEPPDPKALRYVPAMKGVQVTVSSEQDRMVVPVLESSHPAVSFGRRTVLERQDFRSPVKQQEAQIRWAASQKPQRQSDTSTWTLRGPVDVPLLRESEPPPAFLAPKLMTWCIRFCEAFPGRTSKISGANSTGAEFFVPARDVGAQPYEAIEAHRFSPRTSSEPKMLPGFVR